MIKSMAVHYTVSGVTAISFILFSGYMNQMMDSIKFKCLQS